VEFWLHQDDSLASRQTRVQASLFVLVASQLASQTLGFGRCYHKYYGGAVCARRGIPCDLSSVINRVKWGVPCKPRSADSSPLLLSANSLHERFILPSVFPPHFSVRRKLDPEEILTAFDVPGDTIRSSSPWRRAQLVREVVTPGKTLSAIPNGVEEWWDSCFPRRDKRLRCSAPHSTSFSSVKRRKSLVSLFPTGVASIGPCSKPVLAIDHLRRKSERLKEMLSEAPLKPLLRPDASPRDKSKLTKDDDVEVPYHLWDDRLCDLLLHPRGNLPLIAVLDSMRKRLIVRWKSNVTRSFWNWLGAQPLHVKRHPNTRIWGVAAIQFAQQASWWDWDAGSAVFFWR
jgi:hypothetical protein